MFGYLLNPNLKNSFVWKMQTFCLWRFRLNQDRRKEREIESDMHIVLAGDLIEDYSIPHRHESNEYFERVFTYFKMPSKPDCKFDTEIQRARQIIVRYLVDQLFQWIAWDYATKCYHGFTAVNYELNCRFFLLVAVSWLSYAN